MKRKLVEAELAAEGLDYLYERGPNQDILNKVYTTAVSDLNLDPSPKNSPTSTIHKFYDPLNKREEKADELASALAAEDLDTEKIYRGTTPAVKIENEIFAEVKDEKGMDRSATSPKSAEQMHLKEISDIIDAAVANSPSGEITLIIKGTTLGEVTKIVNVKGSGKADFAIVNKFGQEIYWISHKAGKLASDFQQYGGIKIAAVGGLHPEVISFAEKVYSLYGNTLPNATYLYREIKDPNLKLAAMYEDHLASRDFNLHKVNSLIQGHMNLSEKRPGVFELTASHILNYGEVPEDDYRPVLFLSYRTTPIFSLQKYGINIRIKSSRFMIQSLGRSVANSKLKKI